MAGVEDSCIVLRRKRRGADHRKRALGDNDRRMRVEEGDEKSGEERDLLTE